MPYEFLRVKPGAFSPSAVGQQDDNPTWHLIMQSLMTNDSRPRKQNVLNIPKKIPKELIVSLVNRIIHVFMRESTLLEIEPPVTICGDTHGQFIDLLDIVDSVGWPPNQRYLFMGDYIDRGDQSIELICLLYLLKVQNPHNIFILRGNHETSEINAEYGFRDDCMRDYDLSVWDLFQESFKSLPLAAVVGSRIICMHGGLSPCLSSLDDIRKVPRPLDIPNDGLVCDILWSDPMPKHAHDRFCGYPKNMSRGTSVWFCSHSTREFLLRNNLDLVVRGHEVTDEGYEFTEDKKVLTVFSAPYYCGYPNNASVLHVDEELRCQIRVYF